MKTSKISSLFHLPFDQYSRQHYAKLLVEQHRTKKRLRILDVGGNNGKTREFFPDDEVVVLDLYDIKESGYVRGSALDMPFKDNSFDVIVSFDVLEHIPDPDRGRFIREIARVASEMIFIAAPFNTPGVAQVESELNDYWISLKGAEHPWLKEHIENGLPEVESFLALAKQHGIEFSVFGSNNVLAWASMQRLIFLSDAVGAPDKIEPLTKFYNEYLTEIGDNIEPAYRRILFWAKNSAETPSLPRGAYQRDRAQELIKFAFDAMYGLIYGNEAIISLDRKLRKQTSENELITAEIVRLRGTLKGIYHSRTWKLITLLRQILRPLKPRQK